MEAGKITVTVSSPGLPLQMMRSLFLWNQYVFSVGNQTLVSKYLFLWSNPIANTNNCVKIDKTKFI
jgi:hypothetical protein